MRYGLLIVLLATSAVLAAAAADPAGSETWVGVWHATMGGHSTAGTLTLAADTGKLGGTVVLDIVRDDGGTPRVIASDPHVLMNLISAGSSLTFEVKMQRPHGSSFIASFEVQRTSSERATIHCLNCGADAPVVGLVKGF